MSDGGNDDGKRDRDDDQEEHGRKSHDTGGDGPAAASLEEREAVATDSDELMGDNGDE
jgi:hypothetical protein